MFCKMLCLLRSKKYFKKGNHGKGPWGEALKGFVVYWVQSLWSWRFFKKYILNIACCAFMNVTFSLPVGLCMFLRELIYANRQGPRRRCPSQEGSCRRPAQTAWSWAREGGQKLWLGTCWVEYYFYSLYLYRVFALGIIAKIVMSTWRQNSTPKVVPGAALPWP